MDNLNTPDVSNFEKDSKCEKTVQKRRSSIFQSRLVLFSEIEGTHQSEDEDTQGIKKLKECDAVEDQEEAFDLKTYIDSLKSERKEWLETWRQRKTERRKLAKQKAYMESQGQALDLDALSESERAFVAARPNYEQICKNNKRLSDIALKVVMLNELTYKLNERFITRMEERLYEATQKIIKISDS